MEPHPLETPDLSEKGGIKDGRRQALDRRLFMQLLAFADESRPDFSWMADALIEAGINGVLYAEINDPLGLALLTFDEDPAYFIDTVQPVLGYPPFCNLIQKPEHTLLGRTYALGYEPDLEDVLLHRPRRYVLNPDWRWAVWYPLRRSGAFEQLPEEKRREILREHGAIGKAFGQADLAHDIRLACHGLDKHDNDFVVALLGRELYPLSAIVQTMRGTQQTSLYLERLGPFFIGRAVWQSPLTRSAPRAAADTPG
jgi:chlorite dismutase